MQKTKRPPKINRTVRLEPTLNGFLVDIAGQGGTVTDVITEALEEYRVRHILEQHVRNSSLTNMKEFPDSRTFINAIDARGKKGSALLMRTADMTLEKWVTDTANKYVLKWRAREKGKRDAYVEFVLAEYEFYFPAAGLTEQLFADDDE